MAAHTRGNPKAPFRLKPDTLARLRRLADERMESYDETIHTALLALEREHAKVVKRAAKIPAASKVQDGPGDGAPASTFTSLPYDLRERLEAGLPPKQPCERCKASGFDGGSGAACGYCGGFGYVEL